MMNSNFLKQDWCDLQWTRWIRFEDIPLYRKEVSTNSAWTIPY